MKKGYKQSEGHGPGGLKPVMGRNPNKESNLNDAPEGPFTHNLGMTGDGGMHGDETASGKHGESFHFK